jgi:hypothetical protein
MQFFNDEIAIQGVSSQSMSRKLAQPLVRKWQERIGENLVRDTHY